VCHNVYFNAILNSSFQLIGRSYFINIHFAVLPILGHPDFVDGVICYVVSKAPNCLRQVFCSVTTILDYGCRTALALPAYFKAQVADIRPAAALPLLVP
jgi:hypothetical protein